jgi:hypothetical protein
MPFLWQLPAHPQVGKANLVDVLPNKSTGGVDPEESRTVWI